MAKSRSDKKETEFEFDSQLLVRLETLNFKKEYLFSKLQKVYKLSKEIRFDDVDSIQCFLVQYSELDVIRRDFENIITEIVSIELQSQTTSKPSTSVLESFDEIYFICKRVAMNFSKLGQESTSRKSMSEESAEFVRPSLPKLTLFEFDGQLENWPTFYDTFVSLIHNRNFDNIDKFHYLLSCVKGPALNLVKNLPITASNYEVVWQSLLDKYQDKRALVGRYLDRMLSFTPLTKDTSNNLNSFIETFDHSLKAIKALNIKNLDDYLFCHIALRSLDSHTRKLFEESRDQKSLPTFSELVDFVNKQIKVLERTFPSTSSWSTNNLHKLQPQNKVIPNSNKINTVQQRSNSYSNNKHLRNYQQSSKLNLTTSRNETQHKINVNCNHCNMDHMIYRCDSFRKMSVPDRVNRVNALKLCTNCLKSGHDSKNCKSNLTCGVCASPHHYLLHRDSGAAASPAVLAPPPPPAARANALVSGTTHSRSVSAEVESTPFIATENCFHSVNETDVHYGVVLGTARVNIIDITGQVQNCRAVLDSGAQSSFITLDCAQRLGLRRRKCPFTVSGLSGEVVKNLGMVTCEIKTGISDVPIFFVDMVIVSKVSSDMPNVSFPCDVINQFKIYDLADPYFYKKSSIDILLGNDIVSDLIKNKPITIQSQIPNIIETVFGFVVSGKLYYDKKLNSKNFHLTISNNHLDKTLRDFWEIEELPSKPLLSPHDQLAEKIFVNEHRRNSQGRYVVPLLFSPDHPELGCSRTIAERRLLNTERKLARTPVLQNTYNEFMSEYKELDHMELYRGSEPSKYFIPHHSILRPASTSTPLRVVFDASAKSNNNISLNDIQLTGPNLYNDIGSIIINFRLFEYCFTSDICKMYRAILIKESNRKYQHILYRFSIDEPIQIYELKTVTYGISSSPFLAIRTLIQLATDEGERFPSAARIIREGIYMDDILWSCKSFNEACTLQDQLINLLKCGGFSLKKWSSNCPELLNRIPVENRENAVCFSKDPNDISIKLLGLQWAPSVDAFMFTVNKSDSVTTKRSVLKILASIYDPVGFISPCTFVAKGILQELWKLGLGWDEPLPSDICNKWLEFISELALLGELKIERHALLPGQAECELVGFCDASSKGYAACIYAVSRSEGFVKSRLLISKSKVAPVKPLTIPRLELMAAVLLSKLMQYVCNILSRVNVTHITALTDSSIVLAWIQTEPYKLKTFVCNRVTQIIDSIPLHLWQHVSSENNIADICSRGVSPAQLLAVKSQWLEGPVWLCDNRENWPVDTFYNKGDFILELKPHLKSTNLLCQEQEATESKVQFLERILNQFSTFSKLQRTIARIIRLFRCKKFNKDNTNLSVLSTSDLNAAHDCLIKLVQTSYFEKEIKSLSKGATYVPSLRKLCPFLDEHNFLRVGGRLSQSYLPFNAKHPLLLPKKSRFTLLLIESLHKKYLHTGPRNLQNIINQNYWILSARSVIRSVLSKCRNCFKCKPPLSYPKMADLPSNRLAPNKVFEHVGVDLGGPFIIKESIRRNARTSKAYLALFVCYSTKAIHLEVLSSLSAECFLATLDRFVSRRGLCACMYSDCGTNFVAASKHLNDVQQFLSKTSNQNDIIEGCAQRNIDWKFNPPGAPHMGGIWESGIKSAKYHLVRSVGEKALTFEELATIFCKIEAIMNSRPLCALPASDNPNEFNVLTAGHFLVGKTLTAVPEYNLKDVPISYLSRWQYLQSCSQLFWKRWSSDYLNSLQQRAKWFTSSPNLKIGDLVLVKDDQTRPCSWPLARVQEVHPGLDGVVRKVTLRSRNHTFQRPVVKLSPLPFAAE